MNQGEIRDIYAAMLIALLEKDDSLVLEMWDRTNKRLGREMRTNPRCNEKDYDQVFALDAARILSWT